MKITLEVYMDDVADTVLASTNFSMAAAYATGFIRTAVVKTGRIEEHETGAFGSLFKAADNIKNHH